VEPTSENTGFFRKHRFFGLHTFYFNQANGEKTKFVGYSTKFRAVKILDKEQAAKMPGNSLVELLLQAASKRSC